MKQHTTNQNNLHAQEDGFAAIIVTLIIMSIVVLFTIGFLSVVNREQRSAIDRQLSTQAFYAAETAVNDAAQKLAEDLEAGEQLEKKDECDVSGYQPDIDDNISYTCILIDPAPPNLVFDSVKANTPTVIRVNGADEDSNPTEIERLTVHWRSESYQENPISFLAAGSTFPPSMDDDDGAPVLRVTVTPLRTDFSRQQLVDSTQTVFLRPQAAASDPPAAVNISYEASVDPPEPENQGEIIQVGCNAGSNGSDEDYFCRATFTGLSSRNYLVTIRSIYSNASVKIDGQSTTGEDLRFIGQQAIVDATGKASDVLRRIQVRLPIIDSYLMPPGALESAGGAICKQYAVAPGESGTVPSGCEIP